MENPAAVSPTSRRSSSDLDIASADRLRRRTSPSATLSSILADARLRENPRRAAVGPSVSPYYRGLTDSALYLRSLDGGGSPGRENVTNSASSARSISSSIIVRVHKWSTSCFTKRKGDDRRGGGAARAKTPPLYRRGESWDTGWEEGSVVRAEGKSLREKDKAPALPAPEMAGGPPSGELDVEIGTVVGTREECLPLGSEGTEYVWACKYQPRALLDFLCNREQAEMLLQLVIKRRCNHFIFEGPPGVGKRTMVLAFLRETFGPAKLKIKNELKKIELKGEAITSIDVNVKISSHHVEVKLSDTCGYEKHVIVALMNESHSPLGKACDHHNCRVIVLHDAEKVSTDALHYICWLMDKYKGCNRIFFSCYDSSKLQTVKHLCKLVKLQPPSDSEIVKVLEFIAKKEHIELPHHLAEKLAENSKHNLRQAIRSFEATWKSNYSLKENQDILTGWEDDIATIAKNIIEEQGPKQLYIIRGKLKMLIEHNVSPAFIFSTLILELKKHLDVQLQNKIDAMYQEYNRQDNSFFIDANKSIAVPRDKQDVPGSKINDLRKIVHQFMRIEEFIAKFMSLYKIVMTK